MNPHHLSRLSTRRVKLSLLLCAICVVCATALVFTARSRAQEREIEDKIPAHLPVKFKVRNPEKAKDLANDDWLRDIEIEVKNTGTKPIYYLRISLFFMDVDYTPDRRYGFYLVYGRHELMDFAEPLTTEDVPIMPGKTYVFHVSESLVKGWKNYRTRENKPHPKKIGFTFHVLNFGDGTGFLGTSGGPFPGEKSSVKGNAATTTIADDWRSRPPDASFLSSFFLPADTLPVIFYRANFSGSISSPASPQTCCPSTLCQKLKTVLGGNCFCPDRPPATHVETASGCNDPRARCGTTVTEFSDCGEGETYRTCTIEFVQDCGASTPTPTPEESPTPTPEPTPTPATTCDPTIKPNETNCTCIPASAVLPAHWNCRCDINETGTAADYHAYPSTAGCPPDTSNNGNDCCVCFSQSGPCAPTPTPAPPGSECPPFSVVPCPTDELAPNPDTGPTDPRAQCCDYSPVLVDVLGDGFRLTGAAAGVLFDFNGDGLRSRFSWTAAGSDDAWLTLDRDGDGRVGDASELFGNSTPQPAPPAGEQRNGFLALAEFDRRANGGNGDGVIDNRDAVFTRLRLWRDANHDGVSQPSELFTLPALDVEGLHLDYKESKRVDEHGNRFRYRAKAEDARGARVNRWAWDVFLVRAP